MSHRSIKNSARKWQVNVKFEIGLFSFLWNHFKQQIYATRLTTVEDLKIELYEIIVQQVHRSCVDYVAQFWKKLCFVKGWKGVISSICFENIIDFGRIAHDHVDVIFHLRVFLRNMTSICLLSLTFRKNRNVVEYGSRWRSTLKRLNAPKVEPQGWCGNPLLLFLIFYYFYYTKIFSKIPLLIEKYDYEIVLKVYKKCIYKILFIEYYL